MKYLLSGFLLGLAYVAPIGTQNLFVINTALKEKRRKALFTAAAVCFFDISLAAACFFGIGGLVTRYLWLEPVILAAGSAVVIYIGISLIRERGTIEYDEDRNFKGNIKVIWYAFTVTWFNPQAIIDGTMLLGAYKTALPPSDGTSFIMGVFAASAAWWFSITVITGKLSRYLNGKVIVWINRICGAVIIVYGIILLVSFIEKMGVIL